MVAAALKGDFETAREMHLKMFPLFKASFVETNPIPVKTAMGLLGLCSDELRLPLSAIQPAAKASLITALKEYGLSV